MSRFNNLLKWIVFQVNLIASMIGWAVTGAAVYVIFANWGTLDTDFFFGIGIVFILIGLIIVSFSCIGCLGVRIQERTIDKFTGRQVLIGYEFLLVIALMAELLMLSYALKYVRDFNNAYINIEENGQNTPLLYIEQKVAEKFNAFFFGAASVCASTQYQWFWNFVDDHCDITKISQQLCSQCDDYTITACYADETTCDAQGGISGPTCPYSICRTEVISYLKDHVAYAAYGILGLTIFIIIMILLNCCLVCYTKRDTVEEILYKAGIISNIRFDHGDGLNTPLLDNNNSNAKKTVNAREVVHNREIEMMLNRAS